MVGADDDQCGVGRCETCGRGADLVGFDDSASRRRRPHPRARQAAQCASLISTSFRRARRSALPRTMRRTPVPSGYFGDEARMSSTFLPRLHVASRFEVPCRPAQERHENSRCRAPCKGSFSCFISSAMPTHVSSRTNPIPDASADLIAKLFHVEPGPKDVFAGSMFHVEHLSSSARMRQEKPEFSTFGAFRTRRAMSGRLRPQPPAWQLLGSWRFPYHCSAFHSFTEFSTIARQTFATRAFYSKSPWVKSSAWSTKRVGLARRRLPSTSLRA